MMIQVQVQLVVRVPGTDTPEMHLKLDLRLTTVPPIGGKLRGPHWSITVSGFTVLLTPHHMFERVVLDAVVDATSTTNQQQIVNSFHEDGWDVVPADSIHDPQA